MEKRSSSKLIKLEAARALMDEHRAWVLECLHRVETGVKRFSTAIASPPLPNSGLLPVRPITVFEPENQPNGASSETLGTNYRELSANASRQKAASAFCTLTYDTHSTRNQSPKCFGVVGAPAYVIEEARRLNHAKDDLKAAIAPISNLRVQMPVAERSAGAPSKFREVSTMLLRESGRSSINLLAAYRHVPIVAEPVHAIRFLLTHTRSVPRVSVADVRARAAESPGVLATLSSTPGLRDDEPLLSPKKRYARMRAKILLQAMVSPDSKQRRQRIVSADLPILFPMLKADSRWPDVRGPRPSDEGRKGPPSRMEETPLVTIGRQSYFRLKDAYRN